MTLLASIPLQCAALLLLSAAAAASLGPMLSAGVFSLPVDLLLAPLRRQLASALRLSAKNPLFDVRIVRSKADFVRMFWRGVAHCDGCSSARWGQCCSLVEAAAGRAAGREQEVEARRGAGYKCIVLLNEPPPVVKRKEKT